MSELNYRGVFFPGMYEKTINYLSLLKAIGDNVVSGDCNIFAFPTKPILSGDDFPNPINYDLMQVIGDDLPDSSEFVIEIDDPRAGRGPWISGTKKESLVGESLKTGWPVYMSPFRKFPAHGQSMESVVKGKVDYLEYLINQHKAIPVVIANCSSGWLDEIIAAERPDLMTAESILISNGSPRSYWYDTNRYLFAKGRMFGGELMMRLLCDLMDGYLDGAFLSQNFEEQDWMSVGFDKHLNFMQNASRQEAKREEWWNNFVYFFKDEVAWIVRNLFIGNKLERGLAKLDDHYVDLKRTKATRVIVCSKGDTITSVAQSLGFIPQVYASVEEMVSLGVKIVYYVDQKCGHLSIFVSREVAERVHANILKNIPQIRQLPFGLWEMVISPDGRDVRFERRDIPDIIRLLPANHKEQYKQGKTFSDWSEDLTDMYEYALGPYVRAGGKINKPLLQDFFERCHPMRSTRTIFSSLNPLMSFVPGSLPEEPKKTPADYNPLATWQDIAGQSLRAMTQLTVNSWQTLCDFWVGAALERSADIKFNVRNCQGCPDQGSDHMVCGNCPGFDDEKVNQSESSSALNN